MSVHEPVETIRQLAAAFSGTLGVWAHSLTSGETIEWNANEVFPAASTIKLPILYEGYRRGGERRLTPGLRLSVSDLATLMIVVSDNTAANLLIDLVGIAVNNSMNALGLRGTVLENKLMRAPPGARPNRSTPADLGRLLLLIAGHSVLTPASCEAILGILRRQHHTDQITRRMTEYDGYLEQGVQPTMSVASKSGAIRGTRNDVALVERQNLRYIVSLMSRDCADRGFYVDNEAAVLLADVSGFIDTYFRQTNIERVSRLKRSSWVCRQPLKFSDQPRRCIARRHLPWTVHTSEQGGRSWRLRRPWPHPSNRVQPDVFCDCRRGGRDGELLVGIRSTHQTG